MSEKTAASGFPSVQSLLNQPLGSEDAGGTGGTSEYEPSNSQPCSNGSRESTANTQSTSEPRSTAQLSGPGQPMPTTTRVGCMPSPGGSSLVKSSQSVSCPLPPIDDSRRKPNLGGRTASSTEPSYMREAPKNTSLQSMGSQSSFDVTGGFPSPKSTAATSHFQPSMASPETHIHLPPTTTLSPHTAQWNQDLAAHLQGMQPYPIPVTMDERGSKKAQEKRNRNNIATRKHRDMERLRRGLGEMREFVMMREELLNKEVERLWRELGELREFVMMREEHNFNREFTGHLIEQAPGLIHSVQTLEIPPQKNNSGMGMNDFTARGQSYGGGSSPGEHPSKRRRTNQVPRLSTPVYGAPVAPPTSIGPQLPPKQNLQDTSARWVI